MDMNIRSIKCLNVKTHFSTCVVCIGDLTNEFVVDVKGETGAVHVHAQNIFHKFGVANRTEAAQIHFRETQEK